MTVLLYFLINLSYFIPHITGNVDNADVNSRDVQYAYIVGKVYPPDEQFGNSWQQETYVHLAGGLQKGFIRYFIFCSILNLCTIFVQYLP